jgi:hypothetical protein
VTLTDAGPLVALVDADEVDHDALRVSASPTATAIDHHLGGLHRSDVCLGRPAIELVFASVCT